MMIFLALVSNSISIQLKNMNKLFRTQVNGENTCASNVQINFLCFAFGHSDVDEEKKCLPHLPTLPVQRCVAIFFKLI